MRTSSKKAGAVAAVAALTITAPVAMADSEVPVVTNENEGNAQQSVDPAAESKQELEAAKQDAARAQSDFDAKKQEEAEAAKAAKQLQDDAAAAQDKAKKSESAAVTALTQAQADSKQKATAAAQKEAATRSALESAQKAKDAASEQVDKASQAKETAANELAANPAVDEGKITQAKEEVAKAEQAKADAEATQKQAADKLTQLQKDAAAQAEASSQADKDLQAAKQTQDAADKAVQTAQKKVEDLTAQVAQLESSAGAALQQAQAELSEAQKQLAQAQEAEKQAKADLATLNEKASAAKADLEQAKQAEAAARAQLAELQKQQEEAKAKLEAATSKRDALQASLAAARAKDAEAKQKAQNAGTTLAAAQEAKNAADAAVAAAEQRVAAAKAAVDNDTSKADAQKQWDRGAAGFYEAMGSQEALEVLTKPQGVHAEYNPQIFGNDDARTLENMKFSLEQIAEINAKRQRDGGIDGRKLSLLQIDDYSMAIAQANANYSAKNFGHSQVYRDHYENLSTAANGDPSYKLTSKEALQGWWDEEKVLFDKLRAQGATSRTEMDQMIQNDPNLRGKAAVGHYTNLVDDLMWGDPYLSGPNVKDSKVIGYAARSAEIYKYSWVKAQFVHSMVLSSNVKGKSFSVEEYTARFMAYYNDLLAKKTNGDPQAQQEYEAALKALEEAKAEQSTAAATLVLGRVKRMRQMLLQLRPRKLCKRMKKICE